MGVVVIVMVITLVFILLALSDGYHLGGGFQEMVVVMGRVVWSLRW